MARPKIVKEATQLNLYVPLAVKRRFYSAANARRLSMSALFCEWVLGRKPEKQEAP